MTLIQCDILTCNRSAELPEGADCTSVGFVLVQITKRNYFLCEECHQKLQEWIGRFLAEGMPLPSMTYLDTTITFQPQDYTYIYQQDDKTIPALPATGKWVKTLDQYPIWYINGVPANGDSYVDNVTPKDYEVEIKSSFSPQQWSQEYNTKPINFTVDENGTIKPIEKKD